MPGTVHVKVVKARDLPVMDKRSELTDAFVEVKLGGGWNKTEVCPKTLSPQWNSHWFKFNVTDEELQDEPLQLKVMDHDLYSAHDAIGRVYIVLNPLVESGSAHSTIQGWFPIFDTLHGVRGEVYVQVKVELIQDQHRFKQSAFGVQFFSCSSVPEGMAIHSVHGFVEELVVNDDPEYQWIDRLRTPRASNEARQTLFSRLSGELRRRIGARAMVVEANAILGYKQLFDIEGESGVVVRGIGTCVGLIPKPPSLSVPVPVCFPANVEAVRPASTQGDRLSDDVTLFEPLSSRPLTSPQHSHANLPSRVSPVNSDGLPASPAKIATKLFPDPMQATSAGTTAPVSSSTPPATSKHITATSEYPFYTLSSLPEGVLRHIGGLVSARSVKLLDKINNPEDPETRDAWWQEVRDEMRAHIRAMACCAIIGYSEYTSICDTLCVFSATGTAVLVTETIRRPLISPGSVGDVRGEVEGEGQASQTDSPVRSFHLPPCAVCHLPYSTSKLPFDVKTAYCRLCRTRQVPSVLLSTSAVPASLAVRGRGCMVQTRVCCPKRKMKGEENAYKVSKELPFLEYKLHSQLLNKVYVCGMNAVFGLRMQVAVGDTMIAGIAVAWLGRPVLESTWEPKSSLPQPLVADYENGITTEVKKEAITAGGQTIHTLSIVSKTDCDTVAPSSRKRIRIESSDMTSISSGSFTLPEENTLQQLKCRTEKDAHGRLNHRTAGILAGIHPCGTITMVGELFGAESKGQVYGLLHSYLFANDSDTKSLQTICYDDACHLMKYATNPVRSTLTTTAKRLATMNFVVDRMHFKGHVDPWCQENCDPDKLEAMKMTGTAVYVEALPPPPVVIVESKEGGQYGAGERREEGEGGGGGGGGGKREAGESLQVTVNGALQSNRKKYGLLQTMETGGGGGEVGGAIDEDTPTEPDLTAGKKDVFLVDVADHEMDGGTVHSIIDRVVPDGFHLSNLSTVPGMMSQHYDSKMVAMVKKTEFSVPRVISVDLQFSRFLASIIQALVFKVRSYHPCVLSNVRFDVDLPEEEEVQVSVTAMVSRTEGCKTGRDVGSSKKSQTDEFIFDMDDSMATVHQRHSVQTEAGSQHMATGKVVMMSPASSITDCRVKQYLGALNLFLIRESTSIRESGGLGVFMEVFLLEANSIARAHVKAMGGNALLTYQLNKCVLLDHPHKNQAQCLLNISGDAVKLVTCSQSAETSFPTMELPPTQPF